MYLAAMGLGIGALVTKSTGTVSGVSYLAFVAPGLLAGSLLQLSATESTYPVLAGLKWIKTYWAKVATPLSVGDVVIGHLGWVAIRCAAVATIYLGVMAAFGVVAGPLGLLVVPAAVLSAMATAGPITAFSASQDDDTPFALLFRLGVLPMFLFSGVFYPVDRLPRWAQLLADCSPLTHGVHLVRSLTLDRSLAIGCLFDVAYLGLWVAAGIWMTMRIFTKKLVQ
jgi:lipooligosaccharide transport system permease protein